MDKEPAPDNASFLPRPANPSPETEEEDSQDDVAPINPFAPSAIRKDAPETASGGATLTPRQITELKRRKKTRRTIATQAGLVAAAAVCTVVYLGVTGQISAFLERRHRVSQPLPPQVPLSNSTNPLNAPPVRTHPLTPAERKHDAEVAADLHDYVWNGIKRLTPMEQNVLHTYSLAIGTHYTGDANSFKIIREQVIPEQIEFMKQASQLHPKTAEVRSLQELFQVYLELRLLAYKHISEAEHAKDNTWRLTVGAELQASDAASQRFKGRVIDMAAQKGVVMPDQ